MLILFGRDATNRPYVGPSVLRSVYDAFVMLSLFGLLEAYGRVYIRPCFFITGSAEEEEEFVFVSVRDSAST